MGGATASQLPRAVFGTCCCTESTVVAENVSRGFSREDPTTREHQAAHDVGVPQSVMVDKQKSVQFGETLDSPRKPTVPQIRRMSTSEEDAFVVNDEIHFQRMNSGWPPYYQFYAELDRRRHGSLGLTINPGDDDSLLVKEVSGGAVQAWNDATSKPGEVVRRGDEIAEVNGVRASHAFLLEVLRACSMVRLKFRRRLEYEVKLTPPEGVGPGLELSPLPRGAGSGEAPEADAVVRGVSSHSALENWNKLSRLDHEVRTGDIVLAINGSEPRSMLEHLANFEEIMLLVRRPPD